MDRLIEIPLLITNPTLALLWLVFLYLTSNKDRQYSLILLVFLCNSIAFNSLIKYYFKIPLDPSLNNKCWYAFPSGHLQNAIVFFGIIWVKNNFRRDLLGYFLLALLIAGWATNYRKYHSVVEMLAAIPPAVFMIFLYNYCKSFSLFKITLASLFLQGLTLALVESPCHDFSFTWLWLDLGLTVSLLILTRQKSNQDLPKLLGFCLASLYAFAFKLLLLYLPGPELNFLIGLTFLIFIQSNIKIYAKYCN